ncbi:hypothetical protein E4T56_gene12853 [Termitomyces sp. T112]|nr:hypothetical protein E4T56_gene12853 [Termitomyces sp. T112]
MLCVRASHVSLDPHHQHSKLEAEEPAAARLRLRLRKRPWQREWNNDIIMITYVYPNQVNQVNQVNYAYDDQSSGAAVGSGHAESEIRIRAAIMRITQAMRTAQQRPSHPTYCLSNLFFLNT